MKHFGGNGLIKTACFIVIIIKITSMNVIKNVASLKFSILALFCLVHFLLLVVLTAQF